MKPENPTVQELLGKGVRLEEFARHAAQRMIAHAMGAWGRRLLGKITLDCPTSSPYIHAIFCASVPAESHKAAPAADSAIMIFQWLRENGQVTEALNVQ